MEKKIFGASELSTINCERLLEIKNYALYEHSTYMNKIINSPLSITKIRKATLDYNDKQNIFHIPNKYATCAKITLEERMRYKANTKDFPLNNDAEKIFFICNGIFPNDEKFLDTLLEHDFLNMLAEFIESYFYINEKYKDNETLEKMQKYMLYKRLIKDSIKIQNYFYKFHCINDINLIINKLIQICYFNQELYNSYIRRKKANQKIKIG